MNIFQRIRDYLAKRRAQSFLVGIHSWHQTCSEVSGICAEAISDRGVVRGDIGVLLDKMDRKLFVLKNYMAESRGFLRQESPAMAKRFAQASKNLFTVRNQTAKFLIRAQGPSPLSPDGAMDEETLRRYYDRALIEIGIEAGRMNEALAVEIQSLWDEMQTIIVQAERMAAE